MNPPGPGPYGEGMRTPAIYVFCLLLCLGAVIPAGADPLPRWIEHGYGLSVQPPEGASVRPYTGGSQALVTFDTPSSTTRVFLSQIQTQQSLSELLAAAAWEVAYATENAVLLEESNTVYVDRPGRFQWLYSIAYDGSELVAGHAILKVDPWTVVVLQCIADRANEDAARVEFDRFVSTLGLMDPAELNRSRTALLEAGAQWLSEIDHEALRFDLNGDQWFRMAHQEREVGWARVSEWMDTDTLNKPAIAVSMSQLLEEDRSRLNQARQLLLSLDGEAEVWDTRITRHPVDAAGRPQERSVVAWEYIGTRNRRHTGDVLSVAITEPDRESFPTYELPPSGYLTQVERWLLPRLMPRASTRMAFYCFHEPTGQLALMQVRVEPQAGGRNYVFIRPSPVSPEELWVVDRSGTLREVYLPDGRRLVRTTPEELAEVWDVNVGVGGE